jgi:hypothetical protein
VFAWRAAGWIGLVVAVVLGGVALMAYRAPKGETTRLAIGAGRRLQEVHALRLQVLLDKYRGQPGTPEEEKGKK